jgi:hypothetical protein
MDAGIAPARQARAQHRYELRTLTYVTVDQANGGIVRDISYRGIKVQMVAAVRAQQQLRVRFELSQPRVRVETRGEVTWATRSGQCGIRFLDLSPKMTRQINEWIFGNLLEGATLHCDRMGIFAGSPSTRSVVGVVEEDDGLIVSPAAVNVIELPLAPRPFEAAYVGHTDTETKLRSSQLDWLSQPLSGRSLVWTINTLVIVAALLLFALVFLSIAGEPPRWPLVTVGATSICVAALYWGFFRLFGGTSPGERLARMAEWDFEGEEARDTRFR